MNITNIAETGRFTKVFDPSKNIPDEVFERLLALLHSSPSSVNAQPWHFVVAKTSEAKGRVAGAIGENFGINKQKISTHRTSSSFARARR